MKNLIMTCLALAVCANMSGQKLDAMSRVALQQMKEETSASANASYAKSLGISAANTTNNINAVVKLQEGADLSELTAHGFDASDLCSGFAIVRTTMNDLSALAELESVERISIAQRKMELMLNHANAMTGVDLIHDGFGFSGAASDDRFSNSITSNNKVYTGKGVMIGVLDSGFDPNHAMFLDANGNSRFKVIKKDNNAPITDATAIKSFTTDYNRSSHATHVCGIAAGAYDGDDFQIQGVATGADLAMGPIPNSSADLSYVKYLAEYCKQNNERLVINMSFGNSMGPHDGSDVFSEAFSQLIEDYDIVVCCCAGNNSENNIVAKHTFTNEGESMKALFDLRESGNMISCYVAPKTSSPISMDIVAVNKLNNEIAYRYPIIIDGQEQNVNINDNYGKGNITIASETIHDGVKGYVVSCDDIYGKDGYGFGFVINSEEGQTVSCYSEQYMPFVTNVTSWKQDVTSNGTVTNTACAKGMIVVGAYNSCTSTTYKSGSSTNLLKEHGEEWGTKLGDISYYSGYGELYDGETLPHICAPGSILESSFSTYCTKGTHKKYITRNSTFNSKSYSFCSMKGTSMSAPYMAGVAALWLEANPLLTHQEIKEIAMKTAINDKACNEDNHFIDEGRQAGAGKIDAYAGLMYILNENETTLIKTPEEKSFLIRQIANGTYEAYQAGATTMSATLYNMDGKVIASNNCNGNTISINTSNANKGIYLLKVSTGKSSHTQKIVIR